MKVKFKTGSKVYLCLVQEGEVINTVKPGTDYPLWVKFANGRVISFTKDGKLYNTDEQVIINSKSPALRNFLRKVSKLRKEFNI